jgi:hypothetical protein
LFYAEEQQVAEGDYNEDWGNEELQGSEEDRGWQGDAGIVGDTGGAGGVVDLAGEFPGKDQQ